MAEHEHHWESSWAPLVLVVGIVLAIPLTFASYFQYENALVSALFAGVGVPLMLIGLAKWVDEGLDQTHLHFGYAVPGISVFIVSEVFIFLGIFSGYWMMRLEADSWPPAGTPHMSMVLPVIMTVILVSSSFTIHVAEEKLEDGDEAGFRKMLMVTIALALIFFSCTMYEYSHLVHEGFGPSTNSYSTAFYSITGFHASHVLVGASIFVAILIPALGGRINKTFVQCGSIYWHFVDIVWFFVVSQIYFW